MIALSDKTLSMAHGDRSQIVLSIYNTINGNEATTSDAILMVSAPSGSTVSMVKGNITLSESLILETSDGDYDGFLYVIPSSLFDSVLRWTITGVLGGDTVSETILINAADIYEIELSYD